MSPPKPGVSGPAVSESAGAESPPGAPVGATPASDHGQWSIWGISFDARIAQAIGLGMLILLVGFNNHFMQGEYERFLLQFCVPVAVIVLAWREDPRRYGLIVGDWKLGLPIALGGIAIMAPIVWYFGHQPDFVHYYAPLVTGRPAWRLVLEAGLDMFAWEFFFRGWLLWTFGRKYGADAILLQTVPFVLMHLLKPELEQLSTILGGVFFGLLAWRTRSFLWGFLLHWFMVAFVLVVAGGLAG